MKWLTLTLLVLAPFASAQDHNIYSLASGNDLYAICQGEQPFDESFCVAYTNGFADALSFDHIISVPEHATNRQIKDVVIKFLADNPAIRSKPTAFLVWMALKEAFPPEGQPRSVER